jgi:cytidylate kinase
VWLDGADVTTAIRSEECARAASRLAVHAPLRAALLPLQRAFAQPPGLVAEGRDMGTVVCADAPLKLYLTATPEERARRRAQQLSSIGVAVIVDDLCKEIRARDERDSTRAVAPLVPAADAIVIDTTALDRLQVFEQVEGLLRDRGWMP